MHAHTRSVVGLAILVALALAATVAATPPMPGDRTAQAILSDIEHIERPAFDQSRRDDDAYMQEYLAARARADQQEADLILELFKKFPEHEKVPTLLPRRWRMLINSPLEGTEAAALTEMDALIEQSPQSALAGEARYMKAQHETQKYLWSEHKNIEKASIVVEDFIKAMPGDERGARLLGMLADAHEDGSKPQIDMYERILKDFPQSGSAKYAKGKIRQATSVGKPFELSFQDAITGQTVDMNALRGKVVVIDFWATWCGPCVAEMPHMKDLYEQYHAKGVEFIGVSLDQPEDKGGLEKLKKFVADKEIPWPQYYQGNGWESEFSAGWGINGIPTLFIVDKQGNLKSTSARGKLEELIPQLLAE